MCFVLPQNGLAAVYTEKSGNGQKDSVYVAGTPDCCPIEYYDAESESYKGIIPDILNMISKNTGIDFIYIYSGERNEKKNFRKTNKQNLLQRFLTKKDMILSKKYRFYLMRQTMKIRYIISDSQE